MGSKKELRILVADTQAIVRNGIRAMLEAQNECRVHLYEADSGAAIISMTHNRSFDVIIMDICLLKDQVLSTLRELKEIALEIPFIVIASQVDEAMVLRAIEWGAKGFLVIDTGVEEMMKAIRTVCEKERYYSNEISQFMLDRDRIRQEHKLHAMQLTKREWQILQLMTEEFTTDEIALALNISKRTVEGHRINLKSKLQVKSTIGLVKFVLQNSQYSKYSKFAS